MKFEPDIYDWSSWGKVFQQKEAFAPIIKEIYAKHSLKYANIQNLTPGTNAVFRVGDTVVKIFAPDESGNSVGDDHLIELAAIKHACSRGIAAPPLICSGSVFNKYLFHYIVMVYIDGKEADNCLSFYNEEEKRSFALKLKEITKGFSIKYDKSDIPSFNLQKSLLNFRWNDFPLSLREDRIAYLNKADFSEPVFTHGDLTGENVIIGKNDGVFIIDYADSIIAPYYYEWAPLVFGLFGCDPVMMETYFGNYNCDTFYEQLMLSIIMHDFGGGILNQIYRQSELPMDTAADISSLKKIIIKNVESGRMKVK